VAFSHALIALAAKLAVVDGPVAAAEYAAFHALFLASTTTDAAQARSLFVQRTSDSSTAIQYARQIAAMTPGDNALHVDLLQRLFQVAVVDGPLNPAELELLRAVAEAFAIPGEQLRHIMNQAIHSPHASPYELLGVSPRASDKELREHYRARVAKLHPDRHHASGASDQTMAMLSDQLSALNGAYEAVQQLRTRNASTRVTTIASWLARKKGATT
jgi:DnaJ like chaperone protein